MVYLPARLVHTVVVACRKLPVSSRAEVVAEHARRFDVPEDALLKQVTTVLDFYL